MKRKLCAFLLPAMITFSGKAQVALYESFTAPANLTASGWDLQNLSSPQGTNTAGWSQGSSARFVALSGTGNDYFSSDIGSTASAGITNTISAWLLTPTLNLVNGAIVQFATRAADAPPAKADRMQLYYSTDGASNNVGNSVGTATNSAGTFTNLVLDINSSMSALGYVNEWVVITRTLTGIATPTVGRLGFRYYIPDGGASGVNGNYIGIDEFRYLAPCAQPNMFGSWMGGSLCTGAPLTLTVTNFGGSALTYTWLTGSNNSSISVIPTNTGVTSYYVLAESTAGCITLETINPYVAASPTVTVTRNPTGNLCAGTSVTVTASGANTYTYQLGSSTATSNPIVLVTPAVSASVTTQFTVVSRSSTNNCRNTQVIAVNVLPNPTVSVVLSNSLVCVGGNVVITASGASTYSWTGAATSTANPLTYTNTGTAGVKQFTIAGTSNDGCRSVAVATSFTVSACTGIEELKNETAWQVGPNPFSTALHFDSVSETRRLYNSVGQLVYEVMPGSSQDFDASTLPSGIYLLMSGDNGFGQFMKLIKD